MSWFEDLICRDDLKSVSEKIKYCIDNLEKIKKNNFSKLVVGFSWSKLVEKIKRLI
jgi:hypothetical protein